MRKHMRQLRVPVASLQQTSSVLFSTLTSLTCVLNTNNLQILAEFDLRFEYKCSPNAAGSPQLRKGERLLFSANQRAPGRRDNFLHDTFFFSGGSRTKRVNQNGFNMPGSVFCGLRIGAVAGGSRRETRWFHASPRGLLHSCQNVNSWSRWRFSPIPSPRYSLLLFSRGWLVSLHAFHPDRPTVDPVGLAEYMVNTDGHESREHVSWQMAQCTRSSTARRR